MLKHRHKLPPGPKAWAFLPFYHAVLFVQAGGDTTPPAYSSSEEGDVTNLVVAVTFSEQINSGTNDYLTGVTIKRNGVGAGIASAALQAGNRIVHYTLTAGQEADANDAMTWEYSDTLGNIADLAGNQLPDVTAQSVENNVGEHFRFDHEANSMQLVTLGVL